jgi:hypothetical protein
MKRNLFIMGGLSILLAACSNEEEITDPHFMWGGNKYITTYEPVEEERLAERVGVIKTEVDGQIDENGESMGLLEDTALYKIDDQKESPAEILAYHIGNRFYIARKLDVYQ